MNCQEFDGVLDELADGTLTGAVAQEAGTHAAGCAACGRELAGYRRTLALVTPLPVNAFPEAFFARQRAAIMARLATARARQWEAPPLCLPALLIVTAALVAVGADPLGAAFGDLLTNLVPTWGAGGGPDATLTLLPVYAGLLVVALGVALRRDDMVLLPALASPGTREV